VTSVAKEKSYRSVEKRMKGQGCNDASRERFREEGGRVMTMPRRRPGRPAADYGEFEKTAPRKVVVDDNDDNGDEIAPPSEHTTRARR